MNKKLSGIEYVRKRAEEAKEIIANAVSKITLLERQSAKIPVLLPVNWADGQRCLPNEIVRSALFNARNRNIARQYLKDVDISVVGDGKITYRGEELRQDDCTVMLHMIHLAKGLAIGEVINFTAYSFCKAVKWPIGNRSYERLRASIRRMQATSLTIESTRLGSAVSISLIPYFEWKDAGGIFKRYFVSLAPDLVTLFGDVHYTRIDWAQRLELPDGVATWLHTYIASHKTPFPIDLNRIKNGSGIGEMQQKELRRLIKIALTKLVDVGFLKSWEVVDDVVRVVRA